MVGMWIRVPLTANFSKYIERERYLSMSVYTVYKTTNILNGMYYIGVHKTKHPNDNYLGSGTYLRFAIEKYGEENFVKEVLFIFQTSKEAYDKERELVNSDFLKEENTYNLCIGGNSNSFENINLNIELRKAKNKKAQLAMIATGFYKTPEFIARKSARIKQEYADGKRRVHESFPQAFKGKKHSEEYKEKMSEFQKINQSGNKNSQFGSRWCNNGVENLKVRLGEEFPDGYYAGKIKLSEEQRKPRKKISKKKYENYDYGQHKRKFSDDDIKQSLINHNFNIHEAMISLGYKNSNGSSRYRFNKILKTLTRVVVDTQN